MSTDTSSHVACWPSLSPYNFLANLIHVVVCINKCVCISMYMSILLAYDANL